MRRALASVRRPIYSGCVRPFTGVSRATKEGDPGETALGQEVCCDKEKDKKGTVAAGRVITPELDKQEYAPEGMGMDPAEQGAWFKPGDSAGGEELWGGEKGKKKNERDEDKKAGLVEDKITGETLRDADVLVDRKSG